MLNQVTKIFDGRALRLDLVGTATDRRIRSIITLNNTPYFLYVGLDSAPTRENALFVVNPYTDVSMPVNVSQALHVIEGPAIGIVPANCQAVLQWGDDSQHPLAYRAIGRTVVIPVFTQATTGSSSQNATAQVLRGLSAVQPLAIPASARRRTLYGVSSANFTSAVFEGSLDGVTWFTIGTPSSGAATFVWPVPDDVALPPYLRITADGGIGAQVSMVVDL